jgi:hypothetical protein
MGHERPENAPFGVSGAVADSRDLPVSPAAGSRRVHGSLARLAPKDFPKRAGLLPVLPRGLVDGFGDWVGDGHQRG